MIDVSEAKFFTLESTPGRLWVKKNEKRDGLLPVPTVQGLALPPKNGTGNDRPHADM